MARINVSFWAVEIAIELAWLRSYLAELERHLASLPDNPPEAVRVALRDPDDDVRQPMQQ